MVKDKNQKQPESLMFLPAHRAVGRCDATAHASGVPLYAERVVCGFPSPAQDYVEKRLSLDALFIRYPESTYLLRASGDSMRQAGIRDGDLLVVECLREARHGDIVIAAVDGEFTCKRLQLRPKPALLAASNAWAPIPLDGEKEVEIFGIVRHLVHTFRPGA